MIVIGVGIMLFGQLGHGEIVDKASLAYTAVDNPKTAHKAAVKEDCTMTADGYRSSKEQEKTSVGVNKTNLRSKNE